MTQFDAILFTAEVVLICSLIVGIAVFVRALSYEWQDRRRWRGVDRRGFREYERQIVRAQRIKNIETRFGR